MRTNSLIFTFLLSLTINLFLPNIIIASEAKAKLNNLNGGIGVGGDNQAMGQTAGSGGGFVGGFFGDDLGGNTGGTGNIGFTPTFGGTENLGDGQTLSTGFGGSDDSVQDQGDGLNTDINESDGGSNADGNSNGTGNQENADNNQDVDNVGGSDNGDSQQQVDNTRQEDDSTNDVQVDVVQTLINTASGTSNENTETTENDNAETTADNAGSQESNAETTADNSGSQETDAETTADNGAAQEGAETEGGSENWSNENAATNENRTPVTSNSADFIGAFENPDATIQPPNPGADIYHYVDPTTGNEIDETDMDPFFLATDKVYAKYITQQKQPPSFEALGLTPGMIMGIVPDSMESFIKVEGTNSLSTTTNVQDQEVVRDIKVDFVKAGEWIFVNVRPQNRLPFEKESFTYFFNVTDLGDDTVIFREANEECPLPKVQEPLPPMIKKCKWYYSRIEAIYEYYVKITNVVTDDENNLLQCICEGILKLKNQPSIELLCLEDALVTTSHKLLSEEKYNHFMTIYTHSQGNTYLTDHVEEFSAGVVSAQDLSQSEIDAILESQESKAESQETMIKGDVYVADKIEEDNGVDAGSD